MNMATTSIRSRLGGRWPDGPRPPCNHVWKKPVRMPGKSRALLTGSARCCSAGSGCEFLGACPGVLGFLDPAGGRFPSDTRCSYRLAADVAGQRDRDRDRRVVEPTLAAAARVRVERRAAAPRPRWSGGGRRRSGPLAGRRALGRRDARAGRVPTRATPADEYNAALRPGARHAWRAPRGSGHPRPVPAPAPTSATAADRTATPPCRHDAQREVGPGLSESHMKAALQRSAALRR